MKLIVLLEGQVAGTLSGDGTRATFSYSPEWRESAGAYPLSHSLPIPAGRYSGRRLLNFLWGLLPDNELTLAAWARQFQVSARNPLALLAHVGEDCAGAVQFITEDRLPLVLASTAEPPRIKWLTEEELAARVRDVLKDGAAGRTATEGQFSLPGAQAKIALYFDRHRRRWGVPSGRTPTTHILKPAGEGFDGFAENEHFCLQLVRRLGLAAARTEWRSFGDVPTLVAERYDRIERGGRWHRIHQEDFCQALGIHPGSKYESEGGPGFADSMSLLNVTDRSQEDRSRLMDVACLAFLLAATDMHAKNFSLLYARGEREPHMRFAPFYDIASAWPYPRKLPRPKLKLAMRVGGHYRLREIVPRHFRRLAADCNYPADRLVETLKQYCQRVPDEATDVSREIATRGMEKSVLADIADGVAAQCRATLRQLALADVKG